MWLFSIFVGKWSDFLIRQQILTVKKARRISNSIGFVGPAIGMVLLSIAGCNYALSSVLVCIAVGLNGAVYSGFQVNHLDLSPEYAGLLFGITNTVANLAGFVAPLIAGTITNGYVSLRELLTHFQPFLCVSGNVECLASSFPDFGRSLLGDKHSLCLVFKC